MKVVFICPFNLDRLTGTPIRAKTVIKSVSNFSDASAISTAGFPFDENINLYSVDAEKLYQFSTRTIKKLKELRPEIIHCFTTVSVIPMFLYKLSNPRTKAIFEMHGWSWFETKGQLGIIKRIVFFLLDVVGYVFANEVIVMSHTQKNYLAKILYKKGNLDVIWGPVDFPILFEELTPKEHVLVGYQGNSSWWQGLSMLTEAAKILEKTHTIKFQLAGFDSSDKSKFPDFPNMNYVGRFERTDVSKLIKNCDVMVSPRLASKVSDLQYPQKLSEYLAGGRPVIAFDTSDQELILKNAKAGFIVKEQNAQKLAESIQEFAKLPSEKRTELGKNAAKFAEENFSIRVFTDKLRVAYNRI